MRASVGLALATPTVDRGELLRRADLAMYAAKRGGGDRVAHFHDDMLARAVTRSELAQDLRGAVRHGQLELRYQPVVDLAVGTVRAAEALVRWRHPRRGLLGAGEFIALAEEHSCIAALGRFVLDEPAARRRAGPAGTARPPPSA